MRTPRTRQGNYYITLTYVFKPEDGQYSAQCVELGTATCGATMEEALHNIREAVLVDLNALEHVGERERFFRERGIELRRGGPRVRQQPEKREVYPNACTTIENVPIEVGG